MTSNRNKYEYRKINGVKKRLHRHIMEEKLGRELKPNEHVYHLDGDSTNNDVDNLIIITKKYRQDFTY